MSLRKDTRTKRKLYATFGIADYFVVEVNGTRLIHFRLPRDGDYTERTIRAYGDRFTLGARPETEIEANPFLPPR